MFIENLLRRNARCDIFALNSTRVLCVLVHLFGDKCGSVGVWEWVCMQTGCLLCDVWLASIYSSLTFTGGRLSIN